MKISFNPQAEEEFDEAVRYYEECRPGLGVEFAEEVFSAVMRIVEYPAAWSRMSKNTRRCLVNRFPYGIIFQMKDEMLRIVAVADLRRRPGYWKGRALDS